MARPWILGLAVLLAAAAGWLLLGDDEPDTASYGVVDGEGAAGRLRGSGPALGGSDAGAARGAASAEGENAVPVGTVHGFVLERGTRKPIADAWVYALFASGLDESESWMRARTDGRGGFRMPKVPRGTWVLYALHPNYAQYDLAMEPSGDLVTRAALADAYRVHVPAETGGDPKLITMVPARGLHGRVVNEGGQPVPGAEVVVDVSSWRLVKLLGDDIEWPESHALVTADDQGRFRLPAISHHVTEIDLVARAPGYYGTEMEDVDLVDWSGDAKPPEPIELVVRKTARVGGRVTYAGGVPAAGVTIWLSHDVASMPRDGYPITDADGNFLAEDLPPGTTELDFYIVEPFLELPDHGFEASLAPGEERLGLEIELASLKQIRGRLVDASGEPLADESVELRVDREGHDSHKDWISSADTGKDGSFVLSILGEDEAYFLIHDRHDRELILARGVRATDEPRDHESAARPREAIEVRVLDAAGEPVPRFRVGGEGTVIDYDGDAVTRDHDTVVGRNGVARVALRGNAPWTLEVDLCRREDGMPLDAGVGHARLEALPEGPLEIRLQPAGHLEVRIVDEGGSPVPGVQLTVPDGGHGQVHDHGGGRFTVEGVSRLVDKVPLEVTVPEGWVHRERLEHGVDEEDVTIVLRPATQVAGRVVCTPPLDAATLAKVRLRALWNETQWREVDRVLITPADDGSFRIDGIPVGATVWIEAEDDELPGDLYVQTSVECAAGTEDAVLTLARGGRITVRVSGTDDESWNGIPFLVGLRTGLGRLDGEVVHRRPTNEHGRAAFTNLRAGSYDVVLMNRHGVPLAIERGVRLGADVRMVLPAAGSIEGTIVGVPHDHETYVSAVPLDARHEPSQAFAYVGSHGEEEPTDLDFTLDGLGRGTRYALRANVWNEENELVGVALVTGLAAGAKGLRITMEPALAIRGRIEGPMEPVAVVQAERNGVVYDGAVTKNAFDITALPAGRYHVRMLDLERRVLAEIRGVRAGSEGLVLTVPTAEGSDR